MFSLIIAVISIALVALLAVATFFYGGDSFLRANAEAEAARYINESQQISAAIRVFQADNNGTLPGDIEGDLVGYYLKNLPKAGEDWNIADNAIIKSVINADVCEQVNKKAGWTNPNFGTDPNVGEHEPVECTDPSLSSASYFCCSNTVAD